MIVVFQGLPGAGKSMMMARSLVDVLYRNKKWYEKQIKAWKKEGELAPKPCQRKVYHNLLLSHELVDEFSDFLRPWDSPDQLSGLRDVDVFWDEIATHLDATQWQNMSLELKRWLQQHRKFGIEIYGTCQDFAQVDVSFRRLTQYLIELRKLCGSRDISPTRPDPKWIWGITLIQELDPTIYDELKSKFQTSGLPRFMFITRARTEVFDTRAEVLLSSALPLKHIERECERANCQFHKVQHV